MEIAKMKESLKVWRKVFGNWKYSVIAIGVFLLFYSFNVVIGSFLNLKSFYDSYGLLTTLKFFKIISLNFYSTINLHSFISLIIVGALIGILSSMMIYKVKNSQSSNKRTGLLASTGAFIAAFAPGCAACGIGLASLLGIGGATLSLLPYEGLELSILAIVILGIAVKRTTKDLTECPTCKINLDLLKGGKKR